MLQLNRLVELVGPHYERNDSAHDLPHAMRVAALAQKIASEEGGGLHVVLPAALCHDLGKWEMASHSDENGQFIAELLRQAGYDPIRIRKITLAVQRHSFSAPVPPSSLEEKIVFDADKLDSLGAIGVGRCFAVSGFLDQPIFGVDCEEVTAQRLLSERLVAGYDRLHTRTAKRLGEARRRFLLTFIDQLDSELSVTTDYA